MDPTNAPISVDNTPEAPPLISVDSGNYVATPPDPPTTERRVFKAKSGLPALDVSSADMFQQIMAGQEQRLREHAAGFADFQKNAYITQAVNDIARRAGPIQPDDEARLRRVIERKMTPPDSVFEEYFSAEYVDGLRNPKNWVPEDWWKNADEDNKFRNLMNGRDYMTRQELMRTAYEDAAAASKAQGLFSDVVDRTKELLVPFYWQLKQRSIGDVRGLLGHDLEEKSREYFTMPFDKFKEQFKKDFDSINKDDPHLAMEWLQSMMGQSSDQRFMNDIFSTFDLPVIGTAGKMLSRAITGGKEALAVRRAVTSVLDTGAKQPATKAAMVEATGNVQEATVQQATTTVLNGMNGRPPSATSQLFQQMHSAFNEGVASIEGGSGGLRREFVERLTTRMEDTWEAVSKGIQSAIKIEQLPAVFAVETNVRKITNELRGAFPGLENRVMDIKIRQSDDTGLYFVDHLLGDEGATLFKTERTAKTFARHSGFKDAEVIEQQGLGYYVRVTKPLDQTQSVVRDALLATSVTRTPDSWASAWGGLLGKIITPEETLSMMQRLNRKAATFGMSNYQAIAEETAKEINQLKGWNLPFTDKRKKWGEFQSILEASRKERTPDGHPGRLFDNPQDLINFYQNRLHRAPDEQEMGAYFSYKRLEMLHDAWMGMVEYKNLNRLGSEKIKVWSFKAEVPGTEKAKFNEAATVEFNGKRLKAFPNHDDSVLIINEQLGQEEIRSLSDYKRTEGGKRTADEVSKGQRTMFEVSYPDERPFRNFGTKVGEDRPRYIIVNNAQHETKALEYTPSKARSPDWDYDHAVKQAMVKYDKTTGFHWYEGDRTIGVFNIRAMGKDVVNKLNEIRMALHKAETVTASTPEATADFRRIALQDAKDIHARSTIPVDFDELHGWFKPSLEFPGPARLSLTEPIQLVPRNKLTVQIDKDIKTRNGGDNFRNGANEGYGRVNKEPVDPIDVFTFNNNRTAADPLYSVAPLKQLDPITSINRALGKAINANVLNDYKVFSVEHWIQEARQFLKATDEQLHAAPYYYFHHPEWIDGMDSHLQNKLMTANFQVRQFIGIQDKTTTFLHDAAQKLADSIYEKAGSQTALVPSWLLPKLRDPFSFTRSLVFDAKVGLFAVPQLLVQLQTFSTILGVAGPKNAGKGALATLMHQYTRMNASPEILAHLDNLATKFGYRPGELTEARQLLIDSGFEKVAGEHVLRDNPWKYDIVSDKVNTVMDWGRFFFREGERGVRTGAFYTSYKEFRDIHPTGQLSNLDKQWILERADMLSGNMSRASASALQQGVLSIPTQFLSYQLRMAELFMGKRLSTLERTRLFGTYGAIYGVPAAFGLSALPIGDYIRKTALEDGYNLESNWANRMLTEGIPSLLLQLISGTHYNIGERYGPGGLTPLKDLMRSDKTVWDVLGGASFGSLYEAFSNMDGYWAMAMSAFREDNKAFKMHVEDFVAPFQTISALNNTWKTIAALNTGKWMSRKEGYIGDISSGNAIFAYLSGLQPQAFANLNTMSWTRQDETDLAKWGQDRFQRDFHRGIQTQKTNPDQAAEYFKNAFAWLHISGFPKERFPQAVAQASQGYESMVNSIGWQYYNKDVNEQRKAKARQALPGWLRTR